MNKKLKVQESKLLFYTAHRIAIRNGQHLKKFTDYYYQLTLQDKRVYHSNWDIINIYPTRQRIYWANSQRQYLSPCEIPGLKQPWTIIDVVKAAIKWFDSTYDYRTEEIEKAREERWNP